MYTFGCVSALSFFSSLTLLVGWLEGHLAHKKSVPCIPKGFPLERVEEKAKGKPGSPCSAGKTADVTVKVKA